MGEADPAVDLSVAGHALLNSGHADQDEADVVAVSCSVSGFAICTNPEASRPLSAFSRSQGIGGSRGHLHSIAASCSPSTASAAHKRDHAEFPCSAVCR